LDALNVDDKMLMTIRKDTGGGYLTLANGPGVHAPANGEDTSTTVVWEGLINQGDKVAIFCYHDFGANRNAMADVGAWQLCQFSGVELSY